MTTTHNVAILLFPALKLLDSAGPFDGFPVAYRWSDLPAFYVYAVAESLGRAAAKNAVRANPHHLGGAAA
jgi:hypothetical protein